MLVASTGCMLEATILVFRFLYMHYLTCDRFRRTTRIVLPASMYCNTWFKLERRLILEYRVIVSW
jgi:hypothetical protein